MLLRQHTVTVSFGCTGGNDTSIERDAIRQADMRRRIAIRLAPNTKNHSNTGVNIN